jgi:hypothetical protein
MDKPDLVFPKWGPMERSTCGPYVFSDKQMVSPDKERSLWLVKQDDWTGWGVCEYSPRTHFSLTWTDLGFETPDEVELWAAMQGYSWSH